MLDVEEIDERDVRAGFQVDLQIPHESTGGEPEVVAHHDDRLDVRAVALPQGGHQLRAFHLRAGVEPLLELVEDDQHLRAGGNRLPAPEHRQRFDQPQVLGQVGARLPQPLQESRFGLLRRGLDVNRQDFLAEPGQKPRLDQRRFAAARRAVDQTDRERRVGIVLLDAPLPEPEAVGQAVAVARTRQQLEEEVGVMGVEGAQALGDDLERSLVRWG